MKTYFVFIENHGADDFEEYIDAENVEVAIYDICQKYPNLNPDIVRECIEEVIEDDSEDYSPEYPIGGTADVYDIENEKEICNNLEK